MTSTKLIYPKNRWLMLFLTCLVTLCTGSVYAWSVFAKPMASYLSSVTGTEIASLAICFTICNSIGPIFMVSSGYFNDKIGPKWLIIIGAVLFGAGMILSGFARSTGMLILTYGIGVGSGIGILYGNVVSNIVKYFPDKSGLVGGLTTGVSGISSVVVSPIAEALIRYFSVNIAFITIGIFMTILLLICALLIKPCPKDFIDAVAAERAASANGSDTQTAAYDKNWKGMLSTPYFYVMLMILGCGAFSGLMITSQASPIAQNMIGMTTQAAATVVSVLALFNTAGRLLSGFISDKIGALKTLRLAFLLLIAGQALLFISSRGFSVLFIIGVSVVGYCFGSLMGIYPGFTAAKFGSRNNSVNYGIMFCGFAIAGYFGPMAISSIYASTGTYVIAFIIAACLAACGVVLTFVKDRR